jgi:HSP20 family protein
VKSVARLIKVESSPLAPIRETINEVPRLMDRLDDMIAERWTPLWSMLRAPEEMALRLPPVDVFEEGGELVAKAELPGIKREDIEVEVATETITLSGKKAKEEKVERRNYYRFERSSGTFLRTVRLPVPVEFEKAHASFKDGVLEIRVPKAVAVKPTAKKVEIG